MLRTMTRSVASACNALCVAFISLSHSSSRVYGINSAIKPQYNARALFVVRCPVRRRRQEGRLGSRAVGIARPLPLNGGAARLARHCTSTPPLCCLGVKNIITRQRLHHHQHSWCINGGTGGMTSLSPSLFVVALARAKYGGADRHHDALLSKRAGPPLPA